jgi:peptide/nickel transport system permease protein
MTRYLIGRIGQAVLVLWAAFTVAFILLQALPGDAIQIKFQSPDLGLSPAQIATIRASYGVDQPLIGQYLKAIGNTLIGNLGYSVQDGVPVIDAIKTSLPPTLWLTTFSFLAAALLAAIVAFAATLAPFRWLRSGVASLPSLFVSVPTFWLAIALIQIFSFHFKLIAVIGAGPWEGLILPVITIALPISAPLAQILIRSIDDVETQPFVSVARAKGASRQWVLWRHVLRNAFAPTLTIAGVLFGELLTNAIVTETVFGLNGLGRLTANAVNNLDASVLQAVVLLSAVGFVVVNLIVDLLYPVLDPRLAIRVEATS